MGTRLVLVCAFALALAACGGGAPVAPSPTASIAPTATPSPTPVPTATPTPTPAPTPITDEDILGLVYWTEFEFWNGYPLVGDTSSSVFDLLRAMSRDDVWLPYLIDLATVPVPYSAFVYRTLIDARPGEVPVFDWVEGRGPRAPADDTPLYLAFKHKLIAGIQEKMGAFLDPAKPRALSAQEVFWGGVRVDGIPPLESPAFVAPEDAADWIGAKDLVIGVEVNGDARAYPRRIIDWHEMVNDTVGGVPVSLAYCTLCGSAILYDGRAGGAVHRFGTSGLLYRSNKLMYDRATNSLWEQYTGEPVWGDLAGSGLRLDVLPVVHTTWEEWLAAHPDTRVLDIETGHFRDYREGAAYARYFASSGLMFPVPDRRGPLAVKDSVYAVRHNGEVVAYPILLLGEQGFVEDEIGGERAVVFATADRTGGRAYAVGAVRFVSFDPDAGVALAEDGARWRLTESALLDGNGAALPRLPGHNSFWFALTNHLSAFRLYEPPAVAPAPAPAPELMALIDGTPDVVILEWTSTATGVTRWQYRTKGPLLAGDKGAWTSWANIPGSSETTRSYRLSGLSNEGWHEIQIRAWTTVAGTPSNTVEGATPYIESDGIPFILSGQIAVGGRTYRVGALEYVITVPTGMRVLVGVGGDGWARVRFHAGIIDVASDSVLLMDAETGEFYERRIVASSESAAREVNELFDQIVASRREAPRR